MSRDALQSTSTWSSVIEIDLRGTKECIDGRDTSVEPIAKELIIKSRASKSDTLSIVVTNGDDQWSLSARSLDRELNVDRFIGHGKIDM